MKRAANNNRQSGFTLPELVSVMIVSLLFSGLIINFGFEYWRASATLANDLETFVGRLNAGDRLRDVFNESSGLMIQNSIPDSNTGAPDPAISSGLYWKPLHAAPSNTPVGSSGTTTPLLYFRSPSVDRSKNYIMNGSQPYEDEFVLYLDGTSKQLYLRTLANNNAPSNGKQTSCPPALASVTCPADKIITENISSIDMRYFSRSGNLIDYTSIVDPSTGAYIGPDFPVVEVVEFTLHVLQKTTLQGGANTTNNTIIRIALRNS